MGLINNYTNRKLIVINLFFLINFIFKIIKIKLFLIKKLNKFINLLFLKIKLILIITLFKIQIII